MSNQIVLAVAALVFTCGGGIALAADIAAGKAEVDKVCGACHESADWKGKSAAQLEAQIKAVVAGKTRHPKKLDLSEAQIADVAAYWSSAN